MKNTTIIPSPKKARIASSILLLTTLTCFGQTNLVTNGDFEASTFDSGWDNIGATSTSGLTGSGSAADLGPGNSMMQDFVATPAVGPTVYQLDFMLSMAAHDGSQRIRLRGDGNSGNIVTLKMESDGLYKYGSGTWYNAVPGTYSADTTYHIRVNVGNFDADADPEYNLGVSTDGINYTTSINMGSFHFDGTIPFETIRFEGGTGGMVIDEVSVDGDVVEPPPPPDPVDNLLVNSDFEESPFGTGWNLGGGTVAVAGFNGSATAARLPYNTSAILNQSIDTPLTTNFTFHTLFQVAGTSTETGFRALLETPAGPAIEVRTVTGGFLQLVTEEGPVEIVSIASSSGFSVPANSTIHLQVTGRDFGSANAEYDVAWSDPGSTSLTHSITGLTNFYRTANATSAGIDTVRFDRSSPTSHSYLVDDVTLDHGLDPVPTADYEILLPEPDKIVNISGIYPHLVMTSEETGEVGTGAVVPWADRLWAITYKGHAPNGSSDKLYEITPGLQQIIRPESVGGTCANRFIHTASQQLNIGPYFIDTNRTVRVLPFAQAPGRHTATAAHLTDPDNRLYIFTMEDGVYDVNVNDLSFITRYPDVQSTGDRFLHGYHGKGAYSGQGQLVVANNGRNWNTSVPTGPAGVLATWDGTTVADNGGSYLATNDPNSPESNGPETAQPNYIAGWNQHFKVQHCEVTGPDGIYGSSNPATDPVWALGFDDKSVVVRVMEDGATWNTWRLPKGSYSHDGSHGWHTEWPRIRQIDPSDPDSVYLMHMHGIFYDFPKTFSAVNFADLQPICSYYKMPTDYCMFNGQLVMGKDDASQFENPLLLRPQSNLWFGELDDLYNWGSPHGHGGVWKYEDVAADTLSEPFLVNGFSRITLHLKHTTAQPVDIEIQTSNGDGTWTSDRTVTVAAGGYHAELLNNIDAQWIRLKPAASATSLTAYLSLSNPYPHITPAGLGTSEFSSLANIGDSASYSDGLLRIMGDIRLRMEMASASADGGGSFSDTGYHIIGGPMRLDNFIDTAAESDLRTEAEPSKDFGGDAASVWIENDVDSGRLRLPRLDPVYDAEFPSGWARGFREVVTERGLLNCHGTFYEIPRSNSGGRYRMRPITTHGKRVTDFASWRGMLAMTGVRDDAPESDRLVRNAEGAAIWFGEVDDLWEMGEPRGYGGPWLDTIVSAGVPSDPYLMYGYDKKELSLSHNNGVVVNFTVEVDFLADNTWSTYGTFTVQPGETLDYVFPEGFRAQWVRVTADTSTTASAQFIYSSSTESSHVVLSVESGVDTVTVGASNLPTGPEITNILQTSIDLNSGWSDLFTISGVAETNFVFSAAEGQEFYRIKSTY